MDKTFLTSLAGVLLALASSMANGQTIDLDATGTLASPVGTVTFSDETLLNTNTVTAGGRTYYKLTASTSTDLQVNGKVGIRGALGRRIYIRHDLTNMVFAAAASDTGDGTTGTVRIPDAAADGSNTVVATQRESGGTVGSASVIYAAADGAVINADAVVSAFFEADQLAILPNTAGDISMSVFLDLSAALSGGTAVTSKEKTAITLARSVSTSVTPGVVTASVASSFTQLSSLGTLGPNAPQPLGSVNIRVGPTMGTHLNASSGDTVAALTDVMRPANSAMKFSGDFSVGRFSISADGCATSLANALKMNEAKDEATLNAASWGTGARSLCITVPNTNADPIAAGAFMVEADYSPLANAAFGPADLALAQIGRIRQDGTTVQLPYLTTAAEYNQRIVIVNRLSRAAGYNFVITAMDDATAVAGDMASGTVPANATMVLRARDVVTVTGGTDASATLNVVATSGHVDVSTIQVNSRGQTDSVVYETMPN